MPYDTDNRLKSYLDTNQLAREQMCLAILSVQQGFSDVHPRHPRGGPDGGRDIEAIYKDTQKVVCAVGFINQANDSEEQKRQIRSKFKSDLENAIKADYIVDYFLFFTNINITISERDELIATSKDIGVKYCDIYYRERIRIVLDSPEGFYIRFQYLGIPLSLEEQSSFFSKWGENIQGLISKSFTKIENILSRVLFLQEIQEPLIYFAIVLKLNRKYTPLELGHFRAFVSLHFVERTNDTMFLLFGTTDNVNRVYNHKELKNASSEIEGMSGGQWKKVYIEGESESETDEKYQLECSFSSIYPETVSAISVEYKQSDFLRFPPYFRMKDFNESSFMPILSKKLSEKVTSIKVYANSYKIFESGTGEFEIDESEFEKEFPIEFTKEEMKEKWVRIRPKIASVFKISYFDITPKRLYESIPIKEET